MDTSAKVIISILLGGLLLLGILASKVDDGADCKHSKWDAGTHSIQCVTPTPSPNTPPKGN